MKSTHLFAFAGLGLALAAGLASVRPASAADEDVALVRKQCSAFVDAFNSHDPKAMAAAFADDGDTLGPSGELVKGRAAIEAQFAIAHKGPLAGSRLEVKSEPIRFLTPEVALSDAEVEVTGAAGPDGGKSGPVALHVTNVWMKSGGAWKIVASRPFTHPSASAAPGEMK